MFTTSQQRCEVGSLYSVPLYCWEFVRFYFLEFVIAAMARVEVRRLPREFWVELTRDDWIEILEHEDAF